MTRLSRFTLAKVLLIRRAFRIEFFGTSARTTSCVLWIAYTIRTGEEIFYSGTSLGPPPR